MELSALEALNDRFRAAHTLVCGVSVDSRFAHAAWADQLGGISLPLIPDFHPKGEIADSFGVYLPDKGHTDRATIILDAAGTVHYAVSVTPDGQRDAAVLAAECEAIDADWSIELPDDKPPPGLEPNTALYVREQCMFCRWAMYTRHNLHLDGSLPIYNITRDEAAKNELVHCGGKAQVPALVVGELVMYESTQIAEYLCARASWMWP
jgi:hypothetical protein